MSDRSTSIGRTLVLGLLGLSLISNPVLRAQTLPTGRLLAGQLDLSGQHFGNPSGPADQLEGERGVSPNANCAGATVVALSVGTPVTVTGDNTGSEFDFIIGASVVWEAFTITACSNVSVAYCGTTPAFGGGLTLLGVGCPLNNLVFNSGSNANNTACGDGNYTILFKDLPAGTYYYPVRSAAGSMGAYSITFTATACDNIFPTNALCGGAVELTAANVCSPVAGTVEFATRAGNTGNGCGNSDVADGVWYSFVATSTTHAVTVAPSAEFNVQFQVFGSNCAAPAELLCAVGPDFGVSHTRGLGDLTVGGTYLVRVSDWYAGAPRTPSFTICITGCDAAAGTLTATAASVCYEGDPVVISASEDTAPVVPSGFQLVYVLTSGEDLVIEATGPDASFVVNAIGTYTIHALVYDPTTLDLGSITLGETTGTEVNALLYQGGGAICGSLDVVGASVTVRVCGDCDADAGTLSPGYSEVCFVAPEVTLSATASGAVIPTGYGALYLLTEGVDLVIVGGAFTPSFDVDATGDYRIHTLIYDPNTLDLGDLVFGESTAGEVNAQLIQGGGSICASLDLTGAAFTVEVCIDCDADAGTLAADEPTVCFIGDPVTISATPSAAPTVPTGFELVYVLTSGQDLVIENAGAAASFEVDATGLYTIHTLVYDPTTLDLASIVFGETTGGEVNALLLQGGGSICASLDVSGAPITVNVCSACDAAAGTLAAVEPAVCFVEPEVAISATSNGDAVVPTGFQTLYLLTSGVDLIIEGGAFTPSFDVDATGIYRIHTLVYDPATLDLGELVFGESTATEVNEQLIQGGGTICASLDMDGAPIAVETCINCDADAGTLIADAATVCLDGGEATISATENDPPFVPSGFEVVYVLTSGQDLVIQEAGPEPSFTVGATGLYTIHTLVYDPLSLDLGDIVFGETTGAEIDVLLLQGGGEICGSLDVVGAQVTVEECITCDAEAGTLVAVEDEVCLDGGSALVAANSGTGLFLPPGFEALYVLTSGPQLIIEQTGAEPSFGVVEFGDYTIHTLVYDPLTLDISEIVFGQTTGTEVDALLVQGGGSICGSLDVAGAPVAVLDCRPVNDDCSNAIEIPINSEGNCPGLGITGNNLYATEEVENVPGCDATTSYFADVWYTFNSGSNTEVDLSFELLGIEDWGFTMSDACSGGTELYCGVVPDLPLTLTTQENTVYWLRVFSNTEIGAGGEFNLCLSGAAPTFVCDGGEVSTMDNETAINICQDGQADVIDFITTSTSVENYSFVVTDENNTIVALMGDNSLDFNALPSATYRVWGISYNGDLEGADPGALATQVTSTGDCLELSNSFVTVDVEICSGIADQGLEPWSLFPNPANGAFNVRSTGSDGKAMIEVIAMDGRLVVQESITLAQGQLVTLNAEGRMARGVYTVRISSNAGIQDLRLVVQ